MELENNLTTVVLFSLPILVSLFLENLCMKAITFVGRPRTNYQNFGIFGYIFWDMDHIVHASLLPETTNIQDI